MLWREVKARPPFIEGLTDFAAYKPVLPLPLQQFAQSRFAAPVGGRGVEQVDALLASAFEQGPGAAIVGQFEALRVAQRPVPAEFHGAQPQRTDLQASATQRSHPAHVR